MRGGPVRAEAGGGGWRHSGVTTATAVSGPGVDRTLGVVIPARPRLKIDPCDPDFFVRCRENEEEFPFEASVILNFSSMCSLLCFFTVFVSFRVGPRKINFMKFCFIGGETWLWVVAFCREVVTSAGVHGCTKYNLRELMALSSSPK